MIGKSVVVAVRGFEILVILTMPSPTPTCLFYADVDFLLSENYFILKHLQKSYAVGRFATLDIVIKNGRLSHSQKKI